MAKSKKRKNPARGGAWGQIEHEAARERKKAGLTKKALQSKSNSIHTAHTCEGETYKREEFAHDTNDRKAMGKKKAKVEMWRRRVAEFEETIKNYDDVEYKKSVKEAEARAIDQAKWDSKSKIERRVAAKQLDPTKWKLKGAAKPAQEVYTEDIRYVDKHAQELKRSKESHARMVNLLVVKKGCLASMDIGRKYLDANLGLSKALISSGKSNGAGKLALRMSSLQPGYGFEDVMVRAAIEGNEPSLVRSIENHSVWGMWGMALVEFVSWHELGEEGSSEDVARDALRSALSTNVLVGFYLSFSSVVDECLEFKDEVEGAGRNMEEGTGEKIIVEAVEYSDSEQVGGWLGTDMAAEWVREEVLTGEDGKGKSWMERIEELILVEEKEEGEEEVGDLKEGELDVEMYKGMLSTAMEMVAESGVFEDGGEEEEGGGEGENDRKNM